MRFVDNGNSTHALPASIGRFQDSEDEDGEADLKEFADSELANVGRRHKLSKIECEKVEREVQGRLDAARAKWEEDRRAEAEEWKQGVELQALHEARAKL